VNSAVSSSSTVASPSSDSAPLSLHEVTVRFGLRTVLEQLSLEVPRARWTAVVGPNGCGKSTLLRTLMGLVQPEGGRVCLEGRALDAWSRRERARRMAWLPQTTPPTDLTARDCVALGRFAHIGWLGNLEIRDEQAIARALLSAGAQELAGRRVSKLSGGERQRVSLARLLAAECSILLLDEPTTHLDPPHQIDVARILRQQAHHCGATIVSAIHDMSIALMADEIIVMGAHGLAGQGSVSQALEEDWLSRAFGMPISVVRSEASYLWQPHLVE
jgi:ABC-type cobalamin/Fe3+-siderophores transport system ATPase subunit